MPGGAADAAVGMMDGAYFVSRTELLAFLNNLLDLKLAKIEETASGAIACQLTEIIFPNSVPMSKVNWEAKSDYEFVQNYKLLQAAFSRHRVQRFVDVDKLIRGKYQDNLEFCQWLKAFFDQSGCIVRDEYDPATVRARGKGGKRFNEKHHSGGGMRSYTKRSTRPLSSSTKPITPVKKPMGASQSAGSYSGAQQAVADGKLQQKNAELKEKISELEATLQEVEQERDQIVIDVEKERDFYFGKLRSIEVMLQVHQEKGESSDPVHLVDKIFQILYATAEDNLTVNEDGEVVEGDPAEIAEAS